MRPRDSATDCRERISAVASRLRAHLDETRHHNPVQPFWDLVFIVLSARTTERGYLASYRRVHRAFPTIDLLAGARPRDVAIAIGDAGLAKKKSEQLVGLAKA